MSRKAARGVAVLALLSLSCSLVVPAAAFSQRPRWQCAGALSAAVRSRACCSHTRPWGVLLASTGGGDQGKAGARPRPPETEAEKRELEALRRAAAQGREQPSRAAAEVRARARALQDEQAVKAGARKRIADRARELLRKASADARLPPDISVDAVLAKDPQVALLDADLARIAGELKELVPPGLCALAAPSRTFGHVREMNAMPIIQALYQGNDRAQRIAALIIEADRELRFLTDQELSAIQAELAAGDSAEGALLRAAAAVNYLLFR
jgi:hypothetical protein